MKSDVILVGGFHEIIELCEECGFNVVGIIDNKLEGYYCGVPVLGKDDDAEKLFSQYANCKLVIVPDSPAIREAMVLHYQLIGYRFATVISPNAHISKTAEIGEGTIIQSGVNVSSFTKVGRFCKLNCNCNVMHDNEIGDFVTIAPNVVLLGRVSTQSHAYLGANSTVLPNIKIGSYSVVGAGAVVTHDIENKVIVKGNPAR